METTIQALSTNTQSRTRRAQGPAHVRLILEDIDHSFCNKNAQRELEAKLKPYKKEDN